MSLTSYIVIWIAIIVLLSLGYLAGRLDQYDVDREKKIRKSRKVFKK